MLSCALFNMEEIQIQRIFECYWNDEDLDKEIQKEIYKSKNTKRNNINKHKYRCKGIKSGHRDKKLQNM